MRNLLVVTTLYPNAIQPRHGIFVETRLQKLLAGGAFQATVVAPVPWFPFKISRYAQYAEIPREEVRSGLKVYHPRYLVIPKIGFLITPVFLAVSIICTVRRLVKSGQCYELIDAHYYYPDGVAAALASKFFRLPIVITARGSDINLLPNYYIPRKWMQWASGFASLSLTVSAALKSRMLALGFGRGRTFVSRNGVDIDKFSPMTDGEGSVPARAQRTLLSVGNLVELKGHDLVIESLLLLPDYCLLIAGSGEVESKLRELVVRLDLESRVTFLGTLTQQALVEYYNRASVLVLASSREGMPNVLLESMACGTPVVTTAVGGAPEVVAAPEAGVVIKERSPQAIAQAVKQLEVREIEVEQTRKYAEQYAWESVIPELEELMISAMERTVPSSSTEL